MKAPMKAKVTITLKSGVLDPQGKAIEDALTGLGFAGVEDVRQGKYIELDLAETDPARAEQAVKAMCDRLLANTVIENYHIDIT
jgi:phosphoribosylformylglycinamidine synthase subunit PurS